MAVNVSLYLSNSAQQQLSSLKAANATPLKRIDAKKAVVDKQQTGVSKIKDELAGVKTAITNLKAAAPGKQADAVKAFVAEFNQLQTILKTSVSKEAPLSNVREVKDSQSSLRVPFSNIDLIGALGRMGITTTREGLTENATTLLGTDPTSAINPTSLTVFTDAMDGLVNKLTNNITAASDKLTRQETNLEKERTRASLIVDRANARTESSFIKMYRVMQAANSNSNQDNGFSMFG